jgi:hypothetical protein
MPKPQSYQAESGGSLRDFYISRLERLVRLRRDFEEHLNSLGVEILDRSIFATLRDCEDAGAGARARKVVAGLRLAGDGRR